ncbi:hypothetical protein GOBAR_DD12078 [Gossypium barbadense]|nr:hypothetical protein GOBAR_DD12078 [Gossypium barbadense]
MSILEAVGDLVGKVAKLDLNTDSKTRGVQSMDMAVLGEAVAKLKGHSNSKLRSLGKESSGFKEKDIGGLVESNGSLGHNFFAKDYNPVGNGGERKKYVGQFMSGGRFGLVNLNASRSTKVVNGS